ncbi:hypothetical protein HZH68_010653 [Vespula germanica]|uniref:Uncharacterized protein n=1 Tax=Vespula germanica TaxID=30212 RepID=A0A834JSI2_VESGE|nr:hypothetical protein HZH68_010653 [Vespula germanica]
METHLRWSRCFSSSRDQQPESRTTSWYEVNLAVRISPRSECTILNGITTSAEQAVPAKEEEEEKKKKEAKEEKEEQEEEREESR